MSERRSINIHYGWFVIFAALMANIGSQGLSRMAYNLVLPEMAKALDLNYTQAGLLGTGNFTGYLIFVVFGGYLASRYGARIVITFSLLLISISIILTGFARSFEFAFVMRFFTGLGNGGVFVPAVSLGSAWFSSRQRGFATGIIAGGSGVGILLSGLFIPKIFLVYNSQGWSYAWFYMGATIFVICILCLLVLRNSPEEMGLRPVGTVACSDAAPSPLSVNSPLKWGEIYKKKEILYLGAVYFTAGVSYVIYLTFFKAFLIAEAGLPEMQAASMWALSGSFTIFSTALWGAVSDRIGRRYALALVYLNFTLSYLLFASSSSQFSLYASVVLYGSSLGAIPTIIGATTGDYVGARLASAAFGFVTLFFALGQVIGPAMGGYIIDITGSFRPSFFVAALFAMSGSIASLFLKRSSPRSSNN